MPSEMPNSMRREAVSGKITDIDIIQRVLDGDVNAFSHLIHRYEQHALNIVKKHVPREYVEELAQESFIKAFQSLANFKKADSFKQWLSAITVRTCYDFWRKKYRSKEIPISELSDDQQYGIDQISSEAARSSWEEIGRKRETSEILDRALDRLSAEDRMVLELVYLEGLTVKEAANLLGWTVVNVKVRSFRARQKLQKMLLKKGA